MVPVPPLLVTLVCVFSAATTAFGSNHGTMLTHPVSVIEADIFVTKFKTTMRLRFFAEDLELLQGVEALDDGFYDSEELHDATIDHADFLAEKIELRDVDGIRIPAKVVEIEHFEMPEDPIRQGELMKYSIGVVLEFDHEKPPEFLTISQKIIAEGLLLPSELKILLKQQGSDEPYFKMMKPDQPETFQFDWNRPIPASDATEEERSSWFDEQRNQNLGITSYSSVYSFIYITNYQVRHEVLIPLATLNTFFEIERKEEGFLDIPEQDSIAEKVKAFFSVGNPVEIDGVVVQPVFDRIDFYALDLRDFANQADRRKVSMSSGRVGVIMSYSTKGMPRNVKVTWDIFNDNLKTVDAVVFAFDDVDRAEFSMFRDDNTFEWNSNDRKPPAPVSEVAADSRFIKPQMTVPILSAIFGILALPLIIAIPFSSRYLAMTAAAALLVASSFLFSETMTLEMDRPFAQIPDIEDQQADDIFAQLHKNMFRAFDYHNESQIYDALARSVDGKLLRDLYLEINDSLRVSEQGGAISTVEEVRLVDGHKIKIPEAAEGPVRPVFGYRSQWELLGSVEHWGHIHERNNRYDAEFKIELVGKDWKITELTVKDFKPEVVKTRVRKL